MPIIPESYLENELPDDTVNTHGETTMAVESATGFVNSWTSKKYDQWDNYDSTTKKPQAPDVIVAITVRVAKVFYYDAIGEVWRNGEEIVTIDDVLEKQKEILKKIEIAPEPKTQTVSLDSNYSMVIGSRSTVSGIWTRVIPRSAHITSAGSSVYIIHDDFWINRGGDYSDEYPDAWYLRTSNNSNVEGTLSYLRSYRKDSHDYMAY